jgi:hypothetical protein
VQQTPVVRELRIELVANTTTGPQFVERYFLDTRYELGVEYLIDAPAMLVQRLPFRRSFNV